MVRINEAVELELRDGVAVVTVDNPPVNALGQPVRDGLFAAVNQAREDGQAEAIVIACKGRTFIAGADIREFAGRMEGVVLFDVLDAIEGSDKPVVAANFGTTFGGGLELSLCCHYRVAAPGSQFGLPEVKLGLLPGAGGTQRLPRVMGVMRAAELMTSGDPIGTDEALDAGLIDEVVEGDLVEGAIAFARRVVAEGRPLRKVRERDEKLEQARADATLFARLREKIAKRTRGFDAPETIVQCVEAAVTMPFDEAITFERKSFTKLLTGDKAPAQQYYFFAERQANKVPDVPKDTPKRPLGKVGIIGAGTMGGGIAMCFANAAIPVTLVEVKQEALDRGLATVRKNYERTHARGGLSEQALQERLGRIGGSLDMADLSDCDLVIEAVYENMELKQGIFQKLDAIVKPGAILATNTSGLNVDEIAAVTKRPADVVGLHFFSPANVMKLLEVVRGRETAKDVIATAMGLAKTIGKVAVLSGVCRGFIGNRMLGGRTREAQKLILQGALPWDVDRVLYDFGFPMGPFAMSDLAGLDIGWNPKRSQGATIRDRLCEMGRRGQKTGAGYYDYDPDTRERSENPEVAKLIEDFARDKGIERRAISDEEILQRCLYPMINEGAKLLEEGIALRASDIDVVWVNGYGFPMYRGGPMFWASRQGLDRIVAAMEGFAARDGGEAWQPAALLTELAAEGKGF